MDSTGLELVFDCTFGPIEVNFGGSEKLDQIISVWFIIDFNHQF